MTDETPLSFTIKSPSKGERRPRSATPRAVKAQSNDTVDKAVAVMNNVYSAAGVGLVFAQLPSTAETLADAKAGLETANREAFNASPKLAEFIANAGGVSSIAAFFVAHVMTGFSMVNEARKEIAGRTKKEEPARKEESPENGESTPTNLERIYGNLP